MLSDEGKKLLDSIRSSLDIPVYFWISQSHDPSVVGPRNDAVFENYLERRTLAEEQAEAELASMTDLQLYNLYNEPGRIEEFREKHDLSDPPAWYAGGFGSRPVRDYEFWFKMEFWTLSEAVCLSIGFDPKAPELPPPKGLPTPYELEQLFRERWDLIERAFASAADDEVRVKPHLFVEWAKRCSLEVPPALISSTTEPKVPPMPGMLRHVDERKYHSAQKVILALLAGWHGDLGKPEPAEQISDVLAGLEKIGLTMDRKTIKSAIEDAKRSLPDFRDAQNCKDEGGG